MSYQIPVPGRESPVRLNAAQLAEILKVYEEGKYLQAYQRAVAMGPLLQWVGTDARIMASRMAANLGGTRLSYWNTIHAWRNDCRHPEALWYFASYLLGRKGPWEAKMFMEKNPLPNEASAESHSLWYSLHAGALGRLRDFDAAEEWLRKAEGVFPHPWTQVEAAGVFLVEDRHDLAEEAARKALDMRPWYRPAVQWVAHFLVQRERDAEALEFLTQACRHLESSAVHMQLANLQIELGLYDEAGKTLDAVEHFSPLMEKDLQGWLAGRRCDLASYRGEHDKALEYAGQAKGPFYESVAKCLKERKPPEKRVVIPVGFVRQHHQTCAPATLAAISKHWSMPGDHLEVAAAISYRGTPHHSERRWAREHGWYTKEFTVDWASATALIDRGIPFTLTTADVTSAHLQGVIGYDTARGTLILRDPGDRHQVEAAFGPLIERHRSIGPRGMALVPLAEKNRLESLDLPDEALFDHLDKLDLALEGHRRAEAQAAAEAMAELDPNHRVTILGQNTLANYDADSPNRMKSTERLLELFPKDQRLEVVRAGCLREMGRLSERLDLLKRLSDAKDSDPACRQEYAMELSSDARMRPLALYHLKRAIRLNPYLSTLYSSLARIRWEQRHFDESLELYRVAVCLEDKDERLIRDFFQTARAQGQTEKALEMLKKRFAREGAKSSQPARTLYSAYLQLERLDEAFEVLAKARELRPDDGDLLIHEAEARLFQGEFSKAEAILEKADGISQPSSRLRSLAQLAFHQGNPTLARECWAKILEIEPLAEDAHRNYAQILAVAEGHPAALKHLESVCQRFPHHFILNRLWLDWKRHEGFEAREEVLRKLLHIHPADGWVRREHALNLAEMGKMTEAFAEIEEAAQLEPHSPNLGSSQAYLLRKAGRNEEARRALESALELSPENEFVILELVQMCDTLEERRKALAFIEKNLAQGMMFGQGILGFRDAALGTLTPEELLASLERSRNARPEFWQTWIAVLRQLAFMNRGPEALALAKEAAHRFPLLPNLWLEIANVHKSRKDPVLEKEAIERALQLSPGWDIALRQFAEFYDREGDDEQARTILERAVARGPLIALNHLALAELLWRRHHPDAALASARRAFELDPGLESAWNRLCEWLGQQKQMEQVVDIAKDQTRRRPGEARSWIRLGNAIFRKGRQPTLEAEQARLEDLRSAFDQAIRLSPHVKEIYDQKAEALAFSGYFDEARKACIPANFPGKTPLTLRARSAWVTSLEGNLPLAQSQMRDVLKEDPNYFWAWSQMADWFLSEAKFPEYLEAAEHMVRISPQSAMALAYRGEARLRTGKRDDGITDLENALRMDPFNSLAGFLLFEEQIADKLIDRAQATLDQLGLSVGKDYADARKIQLAIAQGNQADALACFALMCHVPTTAPKAIDQAFGFLEKAGLKTEVESILADVVAQKDGPSHVGILYGTRWNPNNSADLQVRIAALDWALESQPASQQLLDLKAELLAHGLHFDRAIQVCETPIHPQEQYFLDGRKAWVLHRSGKTNEGIQSMCDTVAANPAYYWGWNCLGEWYELAGAWENALVVSKRLIDLMPQNPAGYGHRGLAQLKLGHRDAARQEFHRALKVAPTYLFAAWQLFDMDVQDQEYKQAEKILQQVEKDAPPSEVILRKVDLLIYQNKKSAFPKEFKKLCELSVQQPLLLHQSLAYLLQAGWHAEAEAAMGEVLDRGSPVCDQWVRLRVLMGDAQIDDTISRKAQTPKAQACCIAAYALEYAYAGNRDGLRLWVSRFGASLGETAHWSKVGLAMQIVEDWEGVVSWMKPWRVQPGVTPSDLLPLARAYRALDQIEEARSVSEHALTLVPAEFGTSLHRLWLMLEQALAGSWGPVQSYLVQEDLGGMDGYHKMLVAMIQALALTGQDPSAGFARGREHLGTIAGQVGPLTYDAALTQSYHRTIRKMAELRGGFFAGLWRWWRSLNPLLPAKPQKIT